MLKKIEMIYKDHDLEDRQKARHLFVVLVIILSFLPVIMVFDILNPAPISLVVEGLTLVILGASLVALLKGKYRLASSVTGWLISLAMIAVSVFSATLSPLRLFSTTLYMLCPVIGMMLIGAKRRHVVLRGTAGLAVIAGNFVYLCLVLPSDAVGGLVNTFATVLIIYLMIAIVLLVISGSYQKNVRTLTEKHIASLNQVESLKNAIQVSSNNLDIMQALEERFTAMFRELSSIVKQVERIQTDMRSLNGSLEGSFDSIGRVTRAIGDFNGEIVEQTSIIQESSASINQMVVSINAMDRITKERIAGADKLLASAEEGIRKVRDTETAFQEVAESMKGISNVNSLLEEIASQTGVLSLNAEIEAAHAGNFGRGFSVVAGEVRRLAESASDHTKVIGDDVRRLLGSFRSTEESLTASANSFAAVCEEIRKVAASFTEIGHATAELATGGGDIIKGIAVLTAAAQNIRVQSAKIEDEQKAIFSRTSDIQEFARNLSQVMSDIRGGIHGLRGFMTDLRERISASASVSGELNRVVQELKGVA
jgi:methyl-accepting chemotaxis protein